MHDRRNLTAALPPTSSAAPARSLSAGLLRSSAAAPVRGLTAALLRSLTGALLLALAASVAAAQAAPPRGDETDAGGAFRVPSVTRETPDGPVAAFEFGLSGYAYHVRTNGAGRRTKDGKTRLFNLRLEGRDSIRRLYFAEYRGNVILVCEVGDGETGAGFVARLEQPSMRARWRRDLPSANVGPPARDGASLYLTAADFVARLDLDTGEYVWSHERLGKRGRVESGGEPEGGAPPFGPFAAPEVSGEEVLFRELPVYNRGPRAVRVERKTGRIVRIE